MRVLLIVATWYIATTGAPLFCGGTYDTGAEWVALPFEEYGETWQCGDLIAVWFEGETAKDHHLLLARVRDAGPFGKHCVLQVDGSCIRIVVDVPRHLWPIEGVLSAPVRVWNVTADVRRVGVQ